MHTRRLEGGPAEPGAQHLPDLVRTRLESWYPYQLPSRFRPARRLRAPGLWRPLPLVLAVVLLALLAAASLAGPSRSLTDALVNLAGIRPAATPTAHPQGAVPAGSSDPITSAVSAMEPTRTSAAPSAGPSQPVPAAAGVIPAGSTGGLASASRTITPAPKPRPPSPSASRPLPSSPPSQSSAGRLPAQSALPSEPAPSVAVRVPLSPS